MLNPDQTHQKQPNLPPNPRIHHIIPRPISFSGKHKLVKCSVVGGDAANGTTVGVCGFSAGCVIIGGHYDVMRRIW